MTFKEKTKILVNDKEKFSKLEKYVNLIEEYNKVMNLTGFTSDKLWEEGIYESIVSLKDVFGKNMINKKLLDIGAGAGFPSIPFLIVNPELNLTILEPIQKRIKFLTLVKEKLDLNVKLINDRVENFNYNELFDFVTARAVSSLKNLLMASVHVAKINGVFAFIKGPRFKDEINEAQKILKELDYPIEVLKVDLEKKETVIVKIIKTSKSPNKYPMLWKDIKNS